MSKELIELLREVYLQWLDDADPEECADLLGRVEAALAQPAAPACPGIPRPGCNYYAACGTACNKCGKVHSAHLLMPQPAAPVWRTRDAVLGRLHEAAKEPPSPLSVGNADRSPDDIWRTVLLSDLQEILRHATVAQPAQADVERDAARYRWLRTWVKRDVDTQAVVPMTGTFQATALSLDELDAAIDTAMLAAAPEVKP